MMNRMAVIFGVASLISIMSYAVGEGNFVKNIRLEISEVADQNFWNTFSKERLVLYTVMMLGGAMVASLSGKEISNELVTPGFVLLGIELAYRLFERRIQQAARQQILEDWYLG